MKIDKYTLTYRQSIDDLSEAMQEKEALEDRLQAIIARIQDLKEIAFSTSRVCGSDPTIDYPTLFVTDANPDVGFTSAVRASFSPGIGLSPVQVRDRLKKSGFPLEDYKNPLATIHTILKRLVKSKELFVAPEENDGPTVYVMPPAQKRRVPSTFGSIDISDLVASRGKEVKREKKPLPEWYRTLTENGTKPLDLSTLTQRQKREAAESGLLKLQSGPRPEGGGKKD